MLLLELFWSFVKIGFTSFGGLSMIPLISGEMISHGWMTASEVSDIVAIAEMTPGPLGLNCATFAGMRAAGVVGAFVANLGALAPTLTLCVAAAMFFEHFKNNKRLVQIMTGVRPACVGLVAGVIIDLALVNYSDAASRVHVPSLILGLLDLVLLLKFRVSIPKVLLFSAAAGIILFGVLGV
ncbi:MAG: chromate transporter [Synergistaceae bacterium]|nr:chromate transporter [Synergistaceae bacterium]MBR0093701.1 chromate transporter [Synergistaceae bacterium]